jgi:Holliday junction DNA helicase RuvA
VFAVAAWRDQLRHALAGLGFTGKEVADAIEVVAQETDPVNPDLSAALRRSIQLLGRAR